MPTIQYQLRYSKKAKYLQMRISAVGLEVIVPTRRRFSHQHIEQFIQEKQSWIDKYWHKIPLLQTQQIIELPQLIELKAIQQIWTVNYIPTSYAKIKLVTNLNQQITLMGNITNQSLCLVILRQWLQLMAKEHLVNELNILSKENNLPYGNVTIRNNRSRWGSCSSQRNISLCCKLLFLPYPLMRHVLLHELCHTKAMHHGKRFWQLLRNLDEFTDAHVKQLKLLEKSTPSWV